MVVVVEGIRGAEGMADERSHSPEGSGGGEMVGVTNEPSSRSEGGGDDIRAVRLI